MSHRCGCGYGHRGPTAECPGESRAGDLNGGHPDPGAERAGNWVARNGPPHLTPLPSRHMRQKPAPVGHGCVSLGVRQVPWVLPGRRGHFALVFAGVKCPRLPGRTAGCGECPECRDIQAGSAGDTAPPWIGPAALPRLSPRYFRYFRHPGHSATAVAGTGGTLRS